MLRVNISNGEVCLTISEIVLPGPITLDLTRSYGSRSEHKGLFGRGWSTDYDLSLTASKGSITLREADADLHQFDLEGNSNESEFTLLNTGKDILTVRSTKQRLLYQFAYTGTKEMPLISVDDVWGNRISLERDGNGQLLAITDSRRRQIVFQCSSRTVKKATLRRWGDTEFNLPLLTCEYDDNGHLLKSVTCEGAISKYEYRNDLLVSYTNPLGGTWFLEYDRAGHCLRKWEHHGLENLSFQYDESRHSTFVRDGEGGAWLYRLNDRGFVEAVINPHGGTFRNVWDNSGRLLATIDATDRPKELFLNLNGGHSYSRIGTDGNRTDLELDSKGNIIATVDGCGRRWERLSDGSRGYRSLRSPSGHIWTIERDQRGEPRSITEPDGSITIYQRSPNGDNLIATDPTGRTQSCLYDVLGRLAAVNHPDGCGLRIERLANREIVTFVNGTTQEREYNSFGQTTRFTDENGSTWQYAYDRFSRLLQITDPRGGTLSYAYDRRGLPKSLSNENGQTFSNERNALGEITGQISFDGGKRSYQYDAAGRLIGRTDANGTHAAIVPNASGKLIRLDFSNGATWANDYDANGNLVTAKRPGSTLVRKIDGEGRLRAEEWGDRRVSFTYDWRDIPTGIQSAGRDIQYQYDLDSRLTYVREGEFESRIAYSKSLEEVTVSTASGLRIRSEYDVVGQLLRRQVFSFSNRTILSYTFAYDNCGNLVARQRNQESQWRFRYNTRSELTQVERDGVIVDSFSYDLAGNRIQDRRGRYSLEPGNLVSRSPHHAYRYSPEGQRISGENLQGESVSYQYDEFGRLSNLALSDGVKAHFVYDGLWRRFGPGMFHFRN